EQSYGHWQLHAGGELDPYLNAKNAPGDTAAQTNYVLDALEQLHPGFSKLTDPNVAAGLMAKFERSVQGPAYYQGHLPAAQKLLASMPPGGSTQVAAAEPTAVSDASPEVAEPTGRLPDILTLKDRGRQPADKIAQARRIAA